MPKRKIAIAISDWLLEDVDAWAKHIGVSRSGIVQEATAEYLTRARQQAHDEEFRRRAHAAIEDMRRIAREDAENPTLADEPSSLEILRRLRGTSDELIEF